MKAVFCSCLLTVLLGAASVTDSHATPRPLGRYLTATLHLGRHKARLVQRALRRDPLALHTPEQIAERLRPVLTPAQYERFSDLQNDVSSYEMLASLTARH